MPDLHVVESASEEYRKCRTCSELKLATEFRAHNHICKECRKVQQREYYARPEVVQRLQEYNQRTKEQRSARHREYANRPGVAERIRANRLATPWETRNLRAIRNRCLKEGLDFNLTEDDLKIPDYCPVLGIRLRVGEWHWHDASPSVDRIDPTGGYVKGNVAVISWRANRMKYNGSVAEFERLIAWMKSVGAP
jgi:hypothetical protein